MVNNKRHHVWIYKGRFDGKFADYLALLFDIVARFFFYRLSHFFFFLAFHVLFFGRPEEGTACEETLQIIFVSAVGRCINIYLWFFNLLIFFEIIFFFLKDNILPVAGRWETTVTQKQMCWWFPLCLRQKWFIYVILNFF